MYVILSVCLLGITCYYINLPAWVYNYQMRSHVLKNQEQLKLLIEQNKKINEQLEKLSKQSIEDQPNDENQTQNDDEEEPMKKYI